MREVNELGEEYIYDFVPVKLTAWDEASKQWDSTGADQPWDTYGNEGGWEVSTTRHLGISESTESVLDRETREWLSFIDASLVNDGVVYNDFEIDTNGLTLTEFKEIGQVGTPIGYEDLRPLIPGEYTYKKAIVGLRMRSYKLGTTLGFYKAVLNVDVEDIICRGTVEVTSTDPSQPTRADFQKIYYNPPEELMFTVANFTEPCTVEVLTKTEEYFTFMLKSTVESNKYVTGTVSWTSIGY